jgi:hypothetical protein
MRCQLHTPAALTHCKGGSVDTRAGLEDAEERKLLALLGLQLRFLSSAARSQSLYLLICPCSLSINRTIDNLSY